MHPSPDTTFGFISTVYNPVEPGESILLDGTAFTLESRQCFQSLMECTMRWFRVCFSLVVHPFGMKLYG